VRVNVPPIVKRLWGKKKERPFTEEEIDAHLERHLGPCDDVFHGLLQSLTPTVHAYIYKPTPERPYFVAATAGMSSAPMHIDVAEAEHLKYAELVCALPPTWPIDEVLSSGAREAWPLNMLRWLGTYVHDEQTWFGPGHMIPNHWPAQPWSPATKQSFALLTEPTRLPPAARELKRDDGTTLYFWGVVPLYPTEAELKMSAGAAGLSALLEPAGVDELIAPTRPAVI
jgi:hypothetical protein